MFKKLLALVLLSTSAALADTPPIVDIFKMKGEGKTGAVTVQSGVVTNVAPGALGNVLKSDGTNWVSGTTPPAPAAWGSITGTLSSQTDLSTALSSKVSRSGDTMTGILNLPANGLQIGPQPGGVQFGTLDAFSRMQIWDTQSNSILRMGSLAPDGDPTNIVSNGFVVFGQDAPNDPMDDTHYGIGRVKTWEFYLLEQIGASQFKWFDVAPAGLSLTDDTGSTLFSVSRPSGAIKTKLGAGFVQSDSSGNISSSAIPNADATHTGLLTSSDWSGFNGKQPAGNYLTGLTGDVTASGPGAVAATLANAVAVVYVDFILGNDSTGTGTQIRPWKTLQHAYNSISPSVNEPYVIHVAGGNNDTDTNPITGKTNVSVIADYPIQVHGITLPDDSSNDQVLFSNLIFLEPLTWVRNSIWAIGVQFVNTEFFSGPDIEQQGSGTSFVTSYGSQFANSTWRLTAGGVFYNSTFYGTSNFKDVPSSGFPYYEFVGGYNSGAMTIAGGVNPAYFFGMVQDVPFGASVAFTTTANGTPAIETDSAGLPPTYTGTPTLTLNSFSQYIDFTKGAKLGSAGVPTATNVLLEVKDGHTKSSQTIAPTTTVQAAAGTGASCTVSHATDSAGTVQITFGSGSFSAGAQCLVNFNKAYGVAPICRFTPVNASAAADMGSNHQVYIGSTTAAMSINYGLAQNSTGVVNQWNYSCEETQ